MYNFIGIGSCSVEKINFINATTRNVRNHYKGLLSERCDGCVLGMPIRWSGRYVNQLVGQMSF